MSSVCAGDINNVSTISENAVDFEMNTVEISDVHDEVSDVESTDSLDDADAVKESKNTLSDKGEINTPGTYDDFVNDFGNLTSGSVFNVTRDYNLDTTDYSFITLDKKNVTINGNGHMISGYRGDSRIFNVTADGVKINNLVFTNPAYELANTERLLHFSDHPIISNYGFSPIIVNGNNDEVNGCRFIGTKAVNGGSIFWSGSNGKIDNCSFSNVQSKYFGGALYMEGSKNTINNCRFKNCTSGLTQDTIYFEDAKKNAVIQKCIFDRNAKSYDGKGSGLNVSLFADSYPAKVADKDVELYKLLYSALGEGGTHYLDKDTWYYCDYYNETQDLVLNIFRNFTDSNILFGKSYHFNNVSKPSEVFKLTSNFNYYLDYTLIKTTYVNDSKSYSAAIKTTTGCFDFLMGSIMNKDDSGTPAYIKTKLLNIVFADGLNINNNETIMASNLGFNMINIGGHNSTIKTTSKDTDEIKWLVLTNDIIVIANNLTVSGFNTAVENMAGQCFFNNVIFYKNRMDYTIDRDWGAAILNLGAVFCNNCNFTKNHAKNGGAIFNQGVLVLENCSFENNTAYSNGNDVCVGDNGKVVVDGVEVTGNTALVYCAESMSATATTVTGGLTIAASFILGFAVGLATANPVLGLAAGAAVGFVVGSTGTGIIISKHYDVNYDRAKTTWIVLGGSIVAGAAGGALGGFISSQFADVPVQRFDPLGDSDIVSDTSSVLSDSSDISMSKISQILPYMDLLI
ncbi:hypothetical protein [Methanobrevibacter sp.]